MSEDQAQIELVKSRAIERLRGAHAEPKLIEQAIRAYVEEGFDLGLVAEELIDFFCVDTPNILESAGYAGEAGDAIVAIFDGLHVEIRRA